MGQSGFFSEKEKEKSFPSWSLHFSRVESNKHVNNVCVLYVYIHAHYIYTHTHIYNVRWWQVLRKKKKSVHVKEGKE